MAPVELFGTTHWLWLKVRMVTVLFPRPDSPEYRKIGHLTHLPDNVSRLAHEPNESAGTSEADVLWHPPSQHVRIDSFQGSDYYADYLMTTSYSPEMQRLQAKQAANLVDLATASHGGQRLSMVEVGCGDGSFLTHAETHFERVLGIEPSAPFAAEARQAGHEVINGYVSGSTEISSERFTAFASRQVFEHLEDPLDALLGIRRLLHEKAVGLIEVPNGRRAIEIGRYYEVFPDHVNYFSVQSLNALASSAGFSVLSCHESFRGDYLELWVRLNDSNEPSLQAWSRVVHDSLQSLAQWGSEVDSTARSSFFGCGAKALSIAARDRNLFANTFSLGIDSDPHKQGRYVPGTGIEVVGMQDARLSSFDSVFILALSYRDEIASMVRSSLPQVRRIASLGDRGELIRL